MRNYVVALNEIEVLAGKGNSQDLHIKISELQKDLLNEVDKETHSEERTFLIYLYLFPYTAKKARTRSSIIID